MVDTQNYPARVKTLPYHKDNIGLRRCQSMEGGFIFVVVLINISENYEK